MAISVADFKKVIIPMIRKVTPELIAAELVSVQPMPADAILFYHPYIPLQMYSPYPEMPDALARTLGY